MHLTTNPKSDGQTKNFSDDNLPRFFFGLLLCALTILGNYLNIDVFFGINIVFGSIFAWLALIILGPAWAMAAIISGSLYTINLWGHGYAATIFVLEIAFVIALGGYKSISKLIGMVSIYWIFVAAPSSLFLYKHMMGIPWETYFGLIQKQILNGLFNVCLAVTIYYLAIILRLINNSPKIKKAKFSNFLSVLFVFALAVPYGFNEIIKISRSFDLSKKSFIEEGLKEIENLSAYVLYVLQSETSHWEMMLSNLELDTQINFTNRPYSVYSIDTVTLSFSIVFGEEKVLPDNIKYIYSRNNIFNKTEILGCDDDFFYTVSASGKIYVWEQGALDFQSSKEDYDIVCSTDWSEFKIQSSIVPQAISKVTVPEASSKIESWLKAEIYTEAQILALFPTSVSHTHSLRPMAMLAQKNLNSELNHIVMFTLFLIVLSYIVTYFVSERFKRYTSIIEELLKHRTINVELLNTNLYEDQEILKSVVSLAERFSEEKEARTFAVNSFNQLIQDTSTPVFATDNKGRVKFWNKTLENMTGYTSEEMLDNPLDKIAKVDFTNIFSEEYSDELSFDFSITSKSGEYIYLKANQTILRDFSDLMTTNDLATHNHDHNAVHFFVAQDETEAITARAHMINMSRLAALGEMASAFAHELNQPLNVITMAAGNTLERMKSSNVPSDYTKEKLKRIETNALRAGKIIKNIREFTSERRDEGVVAFNPASLCQNVIGILQEQLRLDQVEIELCDATEGELIEGRPMLFEQVIVNIVNNSRQSIVASKAIKRSCKIDLQCIEGLLVIEISDSGSGFNDESISRAFDPFYTTNADRSGTGIGLYMSKSIISSMNGKIWAFNGPNGAIVAMQFPVVDRTSNSAST